MSRIVERIAEEARQEGLIEGESRGIAKTRIAEFHQLIQRLNNFGTSIPEMVRISGRTEEDVLAVLAEIGVKPQ